MKFLANCTLILILFYTSLSSAQKVYIQVGKANIKRSMLSLPQLRFFGSPAINKDYRDIGKELYSTIYNDLDVISFFVFTKEEAFLEKPEETGIRPLEADPKKGFDFKNWKAISSDFLIQGGYTITGDNIELEIFWNVNSCNTTKVNLPKSASFY